MNAKPQLQEQSFFAEGNVTVTNARFVVGNQTYALGGITSVQSRVEPANVAPAGIMLLAGLVMALVSWPTKRYDLVALGVGIVGFAVFLMTTLKGTHHVLLRTSAGEVRAISSQDAGRIARIVEALNNAMIARG